MKLRIVFTTLVFLLSIVSVTAQNSPQHGIHPVYGQVPYGDGEFYARYNTPYAAGNFFLPSPIYHTYPAGVSRNSYYGGAYGAGYGGYGAYGGMGYGYGNSYLGSRGSYYPYYANPYMRYAGVGGSGSYNQMPAYWNGIPGSIGYGSYATVHGYHRPVLYPGIYRTFKI